MNDVRPDGVIILAAGERARMKSTLPKVLHPVGAALLRGHAMRAASGVRAEETLVVIRHQRDRVAAFVNEFNGRAERACRIADRTRSRPPGVRSSAA